MESMTKRTRTFIFILFVFLFALGAPSAVFYSQGYRVDFEKKKIVRTGGLYFRVSPGRANVYLNGEFEKGTSLLTNSAYIENLLPKSYKIEIKKDGFRSWVKTLEVKEKEVTEAENIVLFPESPQFTILDRGVLPLITASVTSTDKKKFIETDGYEIWIMPLEKDREKIFLTRFSEKIGNIFWLNDYYLIFNLGNEIKIAEIDNRDGLNIINLAEFEKPKMTWDKNAGKLYVISGKKLYLLENLLP